ncbi:hypothetical protein [Nakamurella leprariae]|uniref:Uncharacterized protein n=1 Tax=Nakamurella leprariae TaxID=2803911 RepID=A0A938YD01_9ACTN|nr:hypothetical protein [Nakamurella leprariae]MBM9466192.1 hypothetical protein [Nakamurella leprariae]
MSPRMSRRRGGAAAVAGAAVLLAVVTAGCAVEMPGTATRAEPLAVDSRAAFGTFARQATAGDRIPELLDPDLVRISDSRRLASWPGGSVWLAHTAADQVCLVVDLTPPWSNTGGSACAPGPEAARIGLALWSSGSEPGRTCGVVAYPDTVTVTLDEGTFQAAGDGVIAACGTTVAVTGTWPDGRTQRYGL